ncbi:MAG: toll/interleukin-1 receptor domain-containing protein [Pseudomonadota bacterium]
MSQREYDRITDRHAAMGRIQVFYSYAHEDRHHLTDIMSSLTELKKQAIIDGWSDGRLMVGQRWDDEIKGALNRSHIVIFLITERLLKSDYINAEEIRIALERERKGQCQILPVLVEKPKDIQSWYDCPLSKFQPAPTIDTWIDEAGGFTHKIENLISLGVLDVCKAVGGGDNPYRRCRVGDWRRMRFSMRAINGEFAEWEVTEEVLEKTDVEASIRVRSSLVGGVGEKVLTYSLTESLQAQSRKVAEQAGANMSAFESMSTRTSADGPELGEEVVCINMRNYESRMKTVETQSELNGVQTTSRVTQWQSLDAPFDGIVQARSEHSDQYGRGRQDTIKLLAFGNVQEGQAVPQPQTLTPLPPHVAKSMGFAVFNEDAASMQPQSPGFAPPPNHAMPQHGGGTPTTQSDDPFAKVKGAWREFVDGFKEGFSEQMQTSIVPGRWGLETQDQFGYASFDLQLQPNGVFQATSVQNGMQYQLNGNWSFVPMNRMLVLMGTGMAMGYAPMPLNLSFQIDASNSAICYASDPPGRAMRIWRIA